MLKWKGASRANEQRRSRSTGSRREKKRNEETDKERGRGSGVTKTERRVMTDGESQIETEREGEWEGEREAEGRSEGSPVFAAGSSKWDGGGSDWGKGFNFTRRLTKVGAFLSVGWTPKRTRSEEDRQPDREEGSSLMSLAVWPCRARQLRGVATPSNRLMIPPQRRSTCPCMASCLSKPNYYTLLLGPFSKFHELAQDDGQTVWWGSI